ncbi:MAG: tetratricopeptide repeat protein, partial [Candidatus Gastranaerophilales bacterium]|nr:tetratricopeptide repeat protein [Candidatus Gastranaerophilales bacterium]
AKTYYTLIVGTTKSAFNLFLRLHHGLNAKVLEKLGGFPEKVLKTLSENSYIYKKGNTYYPTNFLKQQLAPNAREEVSKEKLAAYYQQQLELAPDDRDITISRATMSSELAYYSDTPIIAEELPNENNTEENVPEQIISKNNENLEKYNNNELFAMAEDTFQKYNYIQTLDILSVILSRKQDITDLHLLYNTYTMLSATYTKLAKWKYALYYNDILEKHYKNINDKENLDKIKYETAHIYYQSYRIMDAIQLLKQLLVVSKNPQILADSNILLGNIALSSSNKDTAIEYYRAGIKHIDANTEKSTALELFFKYAILSDEINDINNAVEYYQKCIEINEPTSKYTALAYSNLGDLFYDNELLQEAKDCFEKAYNADKANSNDFGMYYSLVKIAELTDRKEKDLRLNMLIEAKEHAINTKDIHAIIDSTLKLGDLYYDYSRPNNALSEYLALYRAGKNSFSEYNLEKLKSRLEDIRAMIGKEKFGELAPDYE